MIRLAFVLVYLVAMVVTVISVDAESSSELGGWAALIWGVASVALGLGTGRFSFALLAFLAIPIAVPLGIPDDPEWREPLPTVFYTVFLSLYSAGLTLVAALANRIVRLYRERRKAPPERGFS